MHHASRSLLLITLASAPAAACGICSLAIVDRPFPPAFFWFWWPVGWFLAATLLTAAFGVRVRFLPSLLAGVAGSFAAIILGAAAFGPLSTLPLALLPVLSLAFAYRSGSGTPLLRRLLLALNTVFLLAGVIVGGRGVLVARGRTDAEYICRWSSTGPARAVFKSLAGNMRSRIHLTSSLLALGLACAPQPRATRPASVPANAVLLQSPSVPHRFWASCDPSFHDPRRFVCTFFHETTGARHSRSLFVLVQGDASGAPPPPPRPGAVLPAFTPASLPRTLQLRGFDGFLLSAQPPWLLIPKADPPVRGDPPEHGASSSTPRPA